MVVRRKPDKHDCDVKGLLAGILRAKIGDLKARQAAQVAKIEETIDRIHKEGTCK